MDPLKSSKKSIVQPSEGTSNTKAPTKRKRKIKANKCSNKDKKNLGGRCIGCSKTFRKLTQLRLHKVQCKVFQALDLDSKTKEHLEKNPELFPSTQEKKKLLACKQCPKKFKFAKRLQKHVVQEHSNAPNSIECEQCSVRCPDKATLAEHIANYHDRSLYECQYCKKKFVRAYHVQRHLKQKGCDGDSIRTIACEICNTTFKRRDNLLVHLRSHLKSKEYKCKRCSYTSQSFSRYSSHIMKTHMEPKFECDHCGKVNSSRASIAKHLEIHGDKKYACEVCGYSTHTIEVIRRHVLRHTTDKPYKCELCSASFIQVLQLRRHLQNHVGNSCPTCGKQFKMKSKLIAHQRTHQGLKELLCPYDGCIFTKKSFSTEAALDDHLKTHDTKKLACEVCQKKFHHPLNLKRHMLTHTLDRPRRCMYCVSARAYIRGEMLVRHVRTRHPDIFHEHLQHVRQVMGYGHVEERVKKTEMESILNLLDAISDRIIEQNKGGNVLYGGMQDNQEKEEANKPVKKPAPKPTLLSEKELEESLRKLIAQLIDAHTLKQFGWPDESVDVVLEKVLEQCDTKPADRSRWTRVQRLRENAKHLFLYVIEDQTTSRMLETHTIDQVVMHILEVSEGQDDESEKEDDEDAGEEGDDTLEEEDEEEDDEEEDQNEAVETNENEELEIEVDIKDKTLLIKKVKDRESEDADDGELDEEDMDVDGEFVIKKALRNKKAAPSYTSREVEIEVDEY